MTKRARVILISGTSVGALRSSADGENVLVETSFVRYRARPVNFFVGAEIDDNERVYATEDALAPDKDDTRTRRHEHSIIRACEIVESSERLRCSLVAYRRVVIFARYIRRSNERARATD